MKFRLKKYNKSLTKDQENNMSERFKFLWWEYNKIINLCITLSVWTLLIFANNILSKDNMEKFGCSKPELQLIAYISIVCIFIWLLLMITWRILSQIYMEIEVFWDPNIMLQYLEKIIHTDKNGTLKKYVHNYEDNYESNITGIIDINKENESTKNNKESLLKVKWEIIKNGFSRRNIWSLSQKLSFGFLLIGWVLFWAFILGFISNAYLKSNNESKDNSCENKQIIIDSATLSWNLKGKF